VFSCAAFSKGLAGTEGIKEPEPILPLEKDRFLSGHAFSQDLDNFFAIPRVPPTGTPSLPSFLGDVIRSHRCTRFPRSTHQTAFPTGHLPSKLIRFRHQL
jgi:hypothetical protein